MDLKISRLLVALLAMAGVSTAALAAAGGGGADPKARVIVAFKPGAAAAARSAVANAGGRVVVDLAEVNGLAIEVPAAAVGVLRRNPSVEFVEDDVPRRAFAPRGGSSAPAGALGSQVTPYGIAMVQANQVSDAPAGNRKLCIIDSGIDGSHEDLGGLVIDGVNLTKSGQWYTDENSHGTHVAGTIAAVDNGIGVIGVLPHQRLSLFIAKVFDASGEAPSSVIARAMLNCWHQGANVVNMSLGGEVPSMLEFRVTELLAQRNILLVAAAGNAGDKTTSYPAGFPNVVSVGAIDAAKALASFSQVNDDVELAAPGVGVLSTVPVGSQIAASLAVGGSTFDAQPMENSPLKSATGPLAFFGLGDTPVPGSMTGKVCLIDRGSITFAQKVLNCQNSGGVGAVIVNNVAGNVDGTLGTTVTTIPSIGTLLSNRDALLARVGEAATVAVFRTDDAYASYNGTSMASPHVAGVAALVWSHFPSCSAEQVRSTLAKTAEDLGQPGRDPEFGFGLVQAKAAVDRLTAMGCNN